MRERKDVGIRSFSSAPLGPLDTRLKLLKGLNHSSVVWINLERGFPGLSSETWLVELKPERTKHRFNRDIVGVVIIKGLEGDNREFILSGIEELTRLLESN